MDATDRADIIEAMKLIVTENAKLLGRIIAVLDRLESRVASLESGTPLDVVVAMRRAEEDGADVR